MEGRRSRAVCVSECGQSKPYRHIGPSDAGGNGAGLRGQWRQRIISGELFIGHALTRLANRGSLAMLGLATANIAF